MTYYDATNLQDKSEEAIRLLRRSQTSCFIRDFKVWLESQGLEFPLSSERKFNALFLKWLFMDPVAKNYISNLNLGLINNDLAYFAITARSIGKPWDKYSVKKPTYDKWE